MDRTIILALSDFKFYATRSSKKTHRLRRHLLVPSNDCAVESSNQHSFKGTSSDFSKREARELPSQPQEKIPNNLADSELADAQGCGSSETRSFPKAVKDSDDERGAGLRRL